MERRSLFLRKMANPDWDWSLKKTVKNSSIFEIPSETLENLYLEKWGKTGRKSTL